MKVLKYVFASLVLIALSLQTLLASVDHIVTESHVINLSNVLIDNDMTIGVYEFTHQRSRDEGWYRLEDGTSIAEYRRSVSAGQGWRTFRLVEPIKGRSDNLVFFKYFPSFGRKDLFLPQPDSRWIMILKPALDETRSLRRSTRYTVEEIDDIPILKHDTLFELYDGPNGALCVRWPSEYELREGMPIYSDELPDDVKAIAAALQEHGLDTDVLDSLVPSTEVGKKIVRILINKISEESEDD